MIPTLYRGSVKDVLGPVHADQASAVVFQYTDSYSVFDWGRMPDFLARKGEALAILAADLFEKVELAETWKEFSKTPEALALRKGNRFGSIFNELGEELQCNGLRTHYLGCVKSIDAPESAIAQPWRLADLQEPFRCMAVRQVSVVKPKLTTVLGRSLPDYFPARNAPLPRLIPLEVVFRFSCPPGSSLLDRVRRDPSYLASLGFGDFKIEAGMHWDFPVLELFTKLESTDRPVTLPEALAITGLAASQLQDVLLRTAWIAGWLRSIFQAQGLELADGKLEWGLGEDGKCFLIDAIGPDELRILKNGVQLSKEFLRGFYRATPWYAVISRAKDQATAQGFSEWKRMVAEGPPVLPTPFKQAATQLYLSLANRMTGRTWFPEAWDLSRVVEEIQKLVVETP